ncbi:hypothetical protein SETIT_9G198800v2 [Setaria italica]|uniref:Uncharacterized protein n=2 Tax=Setaria italica TaxID=4555 RepID=A0A368SIF4_SETIT|nr:low-temperature-induced 65 kDa protein [Setaria italica]RCV42216.1 hypothetical protein SETIT_9G198800v2 [Setaria italica]RCV42217.1 hypothetical protein SETIT_9G198800v2 [Setaria italica]
MDAPAMLTRKHVPEDVGLRNAGEDEAGAGGQGQLHRDEKQHKPVLKKVKEKMKKIKNTLAGHGHGGDEPAGDAAGSTSSEDGSEDAAEREAAVEKGGYMEDVEDKPVVTESDPEVHGAPMYESERAPAVQDLVAKYDPARAPAVQEREGDGAPGVRLGDLGGPVVEDPAAPRSTTPAAREGEDIGTTPVVQQFETMNLSDDPTHVGAGKEDAKVEEWKDTAADKMGGATYTDKLKNAAAGTTEYGKKLASTVYEKVAGAGAGKRDDERMEAAPASNTGTEELKDAHATTGATNGSSGAGYTDKVRSAAAGTTEYGKQLASTAYEKVAGVGAAVAPNLRPQVGAGKPDDARGEAMPVSDTGAEEWQDAPAAATDAAGGGASGPGYTDKIKSAAAGTTEYGKQLASTVYEKVAGAGTAVAGKVQQATRSAGTATPGVGAQQQDASAGGQDKGVTVTGYIAKKLQPGDEDRALSEAISGAVQRRKEDVGGTVAQRVPAPGQVVTKAREAVTSLTGGNRVSETVQPSTATGEEVKEGYAAEAPVIHGEEIGDARLNTNTM